MRAKLTVYGSVPPSLLWATWALARHQHNTTHQRHSHSLYLVVTSVHVSHQRRDPPSFNTTRTDRQEVGTFIFSMIDNHRKLGRDSQPVLCLLLLRQLASPSSAGVRRRSRGLELWNASTAVLSLWKWESPGTESVEAQKALQALRKRRRFTTSGVGAIKSSEVFVCLT